jgi:GNAT superfamily N-acetyltransferase
MSVKRASAPQSAPRSAPQSVPGSHDALLERILLRDGSSVLIRRSTAQDEPALHAFLEGLCLDARRLRFFTGAADLDYAAHLTATTDERHWGLIALNGAGEVVAHATYVLIDEHTADVAIELDDHLHGRGLGTILIERLAELAEDRGVCRFIADVLPDNYEMLDVFRVEFPTASWRLARERFAAAAQQPPDDDPRGASAQPRATAATAGSTVHWEHGPSR